MQKIRSPGFRLGKITAAMVSECEKRKPSFSGVRRRWWNLFLTNEVNQFSAEIPKYYDG
jgi:hypothetical protein